jgi:TolB protein
MVATAAVLSSPIAAGAPQLARIAYASGGRIFTIAADGSGRVRLTDGGKPHRSGYGDFMPDYSPDGSRVAFVRATKAHGSGERIKIEVMSSDGTARHVISSSDDRSYELTPRWAPDDRHLAVTRFVEDDNRFTSSIVLMRDDGSHRRTIERVRVGPHSRRFAYVWQPTWAPDGEHLVFTKAHLDRHYSFRPSLISITKRGTDRDLLVHDAIWTAFSPDGSQIVFASIRDRHGSECGSDECTFHGEIYVADSDGTHLRRLTTTLADEGEPDWSADGQRIVFSSEPDSDGPLQLFSITTTGACRVRLTKGKAESTTPSWEPDAGLSSDPGACP